MANEKRLDLINKWDVVNKLIQLENNYQFYKEQWDADVLYRRICELEIGFGKTPTVDAEPVVHGRWVAKETVIRSPFVENYYCSECKTEGSPQWKRCPVCEAKMDGS